jgi:hypothetical protein
MFESLAELVATIPSSQAYPIHPAEALASGCSNLIALKTALILVSALSFLGYGTLCLCSSSMKQEFRRYGMGAQRVWVGLCQWGAGLGLLAGMWVPWLGQAAAGGLAVMMLVAVGVRIRIKDSTWQTLPALLYLLLNAYLWRAGF